MTKRADAEETGQAIVVVGYVYKITNQVNGKAYIGITVRDPEARWREHINRDTSSAIHRAIQKYGVDQFQFEIIDRATSIGELIELEKGRIKENDSYKNGYNNSEGGDFPQAIPITIDGRTFDSPGQAARFYGVDLKLVRNRLSRCGWTIREAFGVDEPPILHSHEVKVEGTTYPSITQAASYYGLDHRRAWSRLKAGWTAEQAMGLEPSPNSYVVGEEVYDSLNDAAEAYGLPGHRVATRLRLGWTQEQAFGIEPAPKTITFRGIKYAGLWDLADKFGLPRERLRRRLKRSDPPWTLEQALEIEDPPNSYRFRGEFFKHRSQIAKKYSIKRQTLDFRIKSGWTMEQATELDPPPEIIHAGTEIKFHYKGVDHQFPSLSSAARAFGVNIGTAKSRLKLGWTIKEALELEHRDRPGHEITIAGTTFSNREAAARHFGIHRNTFEHRLSIGWSPKQAAGLDDPPGSYRVHGMFFPSAAAAAKYFGIKPGTVAFRLRRGKSIAEALGIKANK